MTHDIVKGVVYIFNQQSLHPAPASPGIPPHGRPCFRTHPTSRRQGIGVDPVDDAEDSGPQAHIRKDLRDAALILERRLPQNAQVLHQTVLHDVLYDLVHEVNLSAVQLRVVQIHGKSLFGSPHVHADDLPHEFPQGLLTVFLLILLPGAQFAPQDVFQALYVGGGQGHVAFQLGDRRLVLVLPDIELRLGLIVFQVVVLQVGAFPRCRDDLIVKVGVIAEPCDGDVLDQRPQRGADVLQLRDSGVLQIVRM